MARPHNSPDPFRAVAHPVRRQMLQMLRRSPRTAGELGEAFGLTRPTISDHIRALRVAGLIAFRPRGSQHVYALVPGRLRPLKEWVGLF